MVPFINLRGEYDLLKGEIDLAIAEVIESAAFSGGPVVARFEEAFARFCGTRHTVAVGSGTEALWLSLLALGVGPGDEVITVPNTFFATVEAILFTGARPVFVDVDARTYTMDPALLEGAITPKTKAIVPVHLFGQVADMAPILEVAARHGLVVVEDACQAHGATYKGRCAGALGNAGCFSFYPSKNLGAFGEGGAIVTNDSSLKEKLEMLRNHGQAQRYSHALVGWNGRMDAIQAAVLGVKLARLSENNEARRAHARSYDRLLQGAKDLVTPVVADYGTPAWHLYVVRTGHRDALLNKLGQLDIGCGIHYPVPVHLQEACAFLNLPEGSFPVAEKCAREFLSLPMFPALTTGQVAEVVEALREFSEPV